MVLRFMKIWKSPWHLLSLLLFHFVLSHSLGYAEISPIHSNFKMSGTFVKQNKLLFKPQSSLSKFLIFLRENLENWSRLEIIIFFYKIMMIKGEVKTKQLLFLSHFPFRGRIEFTIPKYYELNQHRMKILWCLYY